MPSDVLISLAAPDDIPGILALQEQNLLEASGTLSVRFTAGWFENAISENSLVACRRGNEIVGYVAGTSIAANEKVPIITAMLRTFPPPANCYIYGPVCVADTERGKGLAGAMFAHLQAHMDNRPAMTFVRADNEPSLRAHRKMGMHDLGPFTNESIAYIAFAYRPQSAA